jgi:protein-S-isoprenylcysteine O-methyltransferase Ste14
MSQNLQNLQSLFLGVGKPANRLASGGAWLCSRHFSYLKFFFVLMVL